jgi:hypothetical protein
VKHYFNDADLELAANEVIIAMDGKCSRADAKAAAMRVLLGHGLEYRPRHQMPKKARLFFREGNDAGLCPTH